VCVSHRTRWIRRARVPPPFFFHRYDFYFFRLRAFCSPPARSRAGTVAITSTHCVAVTLYTRAGDSPLAARARGNSFSALPPLLPYIIARALYARRVYTYTWRAVYTLCVAYICTCCTPSKTYPRGSRLAAAHLNINIRICMYIIIYARELCTPPLPRAVAVALPELPRREKSVRAAEPTSL